MPRHLKSVTTPKKETATQRGKRRVACLAELRREQSLHFLRLANTYKQEAEILAEIADEGARLETGTPSRKSPRPTVEQTDLPDDLTRQAIEEVERLVR